MTKEERLEIERAAHEQLRREYESLNAQANNVAKQMLERRRNIVALTCPYKVGQRVMCRKSEREISRIEPDRMSYGKPDDYQLFARVVLKNGALHKAEQKLHYFEILK